jgi:hypothetical protein
MLYAANCENFCTKVVTVMVLHAMCMLLLSEAYSAPMTVYSMQPLGSIGHIDLLLDRLLQQVAWLTDGISFPTLCSHERELLYEELQRCMQLDLTQTLASLDKDLTSAQKQSQVSLLL